MILNCYLLLTQHDQNYYKTLQTSRRGQHSSINMGHAQNY